MELMWQTFDGSSCAGDHGRALFSENRTDTRTYTADATGDQNHPPGKSQIDGFSRRRASFGASHCASVPSKCLLR